MTALSNSLLKHCWDQHIWHCSTWMWKVVCRAEAGSAQDATALAVFIHHEKKLATLPQINCSVCPTHPENTLLSVRQKDDARMRFI